MSCQDLRTMVLEGNVPLLIGGDYGFTWPSTGLNLAATPLGETQCWQGVPDTTDRINPSRSKSEMVA